MKTLKKRSEEEKGKWVEELSGVLWTYYTMPQTATGESHFSLVFGSEAIIPTKIQLPTLHIELLSKDKNDKLRIESLCYIPDFSLECCN